MKPAIHFRAFQRYQRRFSTTIKEINEANNVKELAEQLGIQNLEDWYNISRNTLQEKGGGKLLKQHGSVLKMLSSEYPKHKWFAWKLDPVPKEYWNERTNQKEFLNWLGKELQLKDLEGWYDVKDATITKYGETVYKATGSSMYSLVSTAYPDHAWIPWKFSSVPKNYWKEIPHQKNYLEWLYGHLGLKSMEDWHTVKSHQVKNNGGTDIMAAFGNSLWKLLCNVYPDQKWRPWSFDNLPKGAWEDMTLQRNYMDWLFIQAGFKELDDWYKVRDHNLNWTGGSNLLARYGNDYQKLLNAVYPEKSWDQGWRFDRVPKDFWTKVENRKAFVEWMYTEMKMQSLEDWYKLRIHDVNRKGGEGFVKFHGSIWKGLQEFYPEHQWQLWRFENVPAEFWEPLENQKAYLDWLAKYQFNIKKFDDWYDISYSKIQQAGGGPLLMRYSGKIKLLNAIYPEHKWNLDTSLDWNSQQLISKLEKFVKLLFPGKEVEKHHRSPQTLRYCDTDRVMALDIWVPEYKLAFEYNGKRYYDELVMYNKMKEKPLRDEEKFKTCQQMGITLIEVPKDWDEKWESLASKIKETKPDMEQILRVDFLVQALEKEEADRIEAEKLTALQEEEEKRQHAKRVLAAREARIKEDKEREVKLAQFELIKKERDAARAQILAERAKAAGETSSTIK